MLPLNSRREGFALAGAVLAMLVVGAIVTGGFYAANQQTQVTRSGYFGDLAQYIAETGMEATMGTVTAKTLDTYTNNTTYTVATNTAVAYGGTNVGAYTATITRLTTALFVVRSRGTVSIGGAQSGSSRTVGNLVRLRIPDFDAQTAMQIFGNLVVAGTAEVNGADTYESNWTDASCTTTSSAAVTAQPGAQVRTDGDGDIAGSVNRQQMDSTNFTVFGDMTWNDVKNLRTFTYADDAVLSRVAAVCSANNCNVNSTCTISDVENWGAPMGSVNHPCYNWFPILYAEGDLHISSNGDGQGILLVEGNLTITSQFEFFGPIVVRGRADIAGGAEIKGSVFAFGGGTIGETNSLAGNMVVQYSSCGIKRSVMGAAGLSRGMPIRNRSWFDLTTMQNSY